MNTRDAFSRLLGTCVFVAASARPASAAESGVRELRYDTAIDVSVTAAGGSVWIASELLKGQLAPSSCHWCDPGGLDASVRSALRWSDTGVADTMSSVSGFALAPLSALGLDALAASQDGAARAVWVDALIIAESTVIAADVNQLVKFSVGRERPFVHALPADEKESTAHPADNNLSFFSGHTTLVFALASSAGTVASMRGYRLAPLVWTVGATIASATGYLRIAADRHYFTDVVTGVVVGGGIGFAVPFFLHGERRIGTAVIDGLSVRPVPGGQTLMLAGIW